MTFNVSFIIFAVLAMSYRMWDSFINNNERQGHIFSSWTLPIIFIISWSIFIGTLIELFMIKKQINVFISVISLIIFTLSLFIRSLAKKQLGKFYSNHIKVYADHKLIKSGMYKRMRHPYYLFFILEALFFPLTANSYFTFFGGAILLIPLIIYRAIKEDRVLKKHFGPTFESYQATTGSFLPRNLFTNSKCD